MYIHRVATQQAQYLKLKFCSSQDKPSEPLRYEGGKPVTVDSLYNLADIELYPPETGEESPLQRGFKAAGLTPSGGSRQLTNVLRDVEENKPNPNYAQGNLESALEKLGVNTFENPDGVSDLADQIRLRARINPK